MLYKSIYLLFIISGLMAALLTGTTPLPCHLITTVSPDQKHFNSCKSYHCEESHCLGHSDLNEMCELWVPVTCHSQVIVTLVWSNNTTLLGFPTQNLAFILVWKTKFKAYWVMHGNDHPTHILHPMPGITYALLHKEGRYSSLLSCYY